MITYSKTTWGLHLLLRLYGSAIPRTLPFAVTSSLLTVLFYYYPHRSYFQEALVHPYPYQLFATMIGFALIFRTNFGYSRYWEGRGLLQGMTGSLADMCGRALSYEAVSLSAPPRSRHHHHQQQQQQQQRGAQGQGGSTPCSSPGFNSGGRAASAGPPLLQAQRLEQVPEGSQEMAVAAAATVAVAAEGVAGPGAPPAGHPPPAAAEAQQQLSHPLAHPLASEGSAQAAPAAPVGPGGAAGGGGAAAAAGGGDYAWGSALNQYWREQDGTAQNGLSAAPSPRPPQALAPVQPPQPQSQLQPAVLPLRLPSGALPRIQHQLQMERQLPKTLAPASHQEVRRFVAFKEELLHLASLFHALALQHLRDDWRLDNLTIFSEGNPPPPLDSRGLKGYRTPWVEMFLLRGRPKDREAYNRAMKLPVIGPLTPQRRTLLRQFSEADPKAVTETLFSGLDQGQGRPPTSPRGSARTRALFRLSFLEHTLGSTIEGGADRVYQAFNWVQLLLVTRTRDEGRGGWKLPAPITTAVLTQLSSCFTNFEQCRKLADTPFPWPWAQSIVVMLLIYSLTVPIMMVSYVKDLWIAVVLTFVSVLTYWALNEVARDLEDPFIYDPNDLPLARHQYDFNKRVLAAAETILYTLQMGGP